MASKVVKTVRPLVKKEKQKSLPGMEDRKLPELHSAAEEYVSIRDHRMQLTEEEVEAKANVLQLMLKHDKTVYVCEDIEIKRVHEEETIKVRRLKKAKDEKK